jgi:hypothetical protein
MLILEKIKSKENLKNNTLFHVQIIKQPNKMICKNILKTNLCKIINSNFKEDSHSV